MDAGAALLSDADATVAMVLGMSAIEHPAMPSEVAAALDASPGDARDDAAGTAIPAASAVVKALGSVALVLRAILEWKLA